MTQHNQSTQSTMSMDRTAEDGSPKASATKSPSTQLMERSDDSSFRIPPVFSKSKSTSPGQWSSVSNESLFSIHTDSKNFTWRSGELGINGEHSSPCHIFSFTSSQSGHNSWKFDKGTEASVAVETMKVVIKESSGGLTKEQLATIQGQKTHHHPRATGGTSTASFAFPVLAGDFEKDASTKIILSTKIISPVTVEPEKTPAEGPKETNNPSPSNNQSKKETSTKSDSENSKENSNTAQSSWFSCFPCCRSSS